MRNKLGQFIKYVFTGCIAFYTVDNCYAQRKDTVRASAYENLSLKDLLNVKIISISKNEENLVEAPLSASVVTRDDIYKAGCTSIMEALRLVPGMIVREESNGNYDIHLRGMDNVPPNSSFDITSNTTTLVMIDNRPIYSYLRGGTFWETLPISLNDVSRIEVIRGPAAAIYGPNAVNGVINIITSRNYKQGLYFRTTATQGSNNTRINNASVGYKYKQWSVIASGNYEHRDRSQTSYYEIATDRTVQDPAYFIGFGGDTVKDVHTRYPTRELAMEKYAGNLFVSYQRARKIKFEINTGAQHSMAQRVSTENEVTPLSTTQSDSRYIDVSGTLKRISGQASYNAGTQYAEFSPGNKYDFSILNANLEYQFNKKNFSIKPGISYQNAIYDDTRYSDIAHKTGIFNNRGRITSVSASLHAEYRLWKNRLRFIGGLATSTFNEPDSTCLSYELAATCKLTKKHMVRAVYSKAPRSSNVFDTYVDQTIGTFRTGNNRYESVALRGNRNLQLLTAGMFELGYRGQVGRHLIVDVELFHIKAKNFNTMAMSNPFTMVAGADTIQMSVISATTLPMKLIQNGITVSVAWKQRKLQLRPFITVQHTEILDYAPLNMMPGNIQRSIYAGLGNRETLKSTPAVYGGGSMDYRVARNINVNISSYYYTSQTYQHLANIIFNDGVRGIDHIAGKVILNANITFSPVKGLQLFCSGKNLLNQTSREFYRTDHVPFMMLGGFNYQF